MAVPHGSTRGSTVCGDSTEGSREEDILDTTARGESRKLSDSGISSEEMGQQEEEEGNEKGREGGWSWLVVLAG